MITTEKLANTVCRYKVSTCYQLDGSDKRLLHDSYLPAFFVYGWHHSATFSDNYHPVSMIRKGKYFSWPGKNKNNSPYRTSELFVLVTLDLLSTSEVVANQSHVTLKWFSGAVPITVK